MGNDHDVQNLDVLCAEKGWKLAGIDKMEERILNAALSVLEEQGPYAMLLYLKARHSEIFNQVEKEFKALLQEAVQLHADEQADILAMVSTFAEDLDNLLFTRDLFRNTLAYARYHLKAGGGGEETQ